MKSFMLGLLTVVIVATSVHPQNRTDKEATYALVGPVRTVRTETASVLKDDGRTSRPNGSPMLREPGRSK